MLPQLQIADATPTPSGYYVFGGLTLLLARIRVDWSATFRYTDWNLACFPA